MGMRKPAHAGALCTIAALLLPALAHAQDVTISGTAYNESGAGVAPFSLSFVASGYSSGLCEAYQLGFPFSGFVQFNFANGFTATAPDGQAVPTASCGGLLFGVVGAGAYEYSYNEPGTAVFAAPPPPAGWGLTVTEIASVPEPGALGLMLLGLLGVVVGPWSKRSGACAN
jgi:hypothetical protein